MKQKTFVFMTEFGEVLDVALHIQDIEKQKVLFHTESKEYKKIGDGLMIKNEEWYRCLGEGYVWVFDGCAHGDMQDWLRERGEAVFGGSKIGDNMENDRQMGQALFKAAGFKQPESHNYKSIEEALDFIHENSDGRRWILKQNGDAPKSINHMGKFESGQDMILHLEHLKKTWNETEYGAFDCDLMEVVEGTEVAASAFWNGHDWMRNKEGNVVGFLNFEEKKEIDGNLGATTGEMGTTFLGVTEDNELFKKILVNKEIEKALKKAGFRGVFDINGCVTDDGDFIGFEPTCRFGVPASSYEFIEGLETPASEVIDAVARGLDTPIEVKQTVGMVMVVAAKPFPVEAHLEDDQTSMGEILWFLENGEEKNEMNDEQKRRIHLYNFYVDEDEGFLKVATDSGYLLTVTGVGRTVEECREDLIQFIRDNIYISGMKWRSDIGKRIEDFVGEQIEA